MDSLTPVWPAVLGFPVFLIMHLLLWQFLPQKRKGVLALVATSAASYIIACGYFGPADLGNHIWTSLPLQAFLTVFYMHLYFGVDRSLSVRILGELSKSPGEVVSFEKLDDFYPKRDMIERRVQVLAEKGLLDANADGSFSCTAKGRFLVRLAMLGKRLYNLSATG